MVQKLQLFSNHLSKLIILQDLLQDICKIGFDVNLIKLILFLH